MPKTVTLLIFFVIVCCPLCAQVFPKEGDNLNYRIVGFSFPAQGAGGKYTLEIAKGDCTDEKSFNKSIFNKVAGSNGREIVELPSFGSAYTWRVIFSGKREKKVYYHFSTGMCPETDTANERLRIAKPALKYKDAFVFMDGNRVLYDMKGAPVWYLPTNKDFSITPADTSQVAAGRKGIPVTDLKLSPQGTITFMLNEQAFEVNYEGDILWQGPDNALTINGVKGDYHHEFTRLANGNYMVIGYETSYVLKNIAADKRKKIIPDSSDYKSAETDTCYRKAQFGTITEYDKKGKVVWHWSGSSYFRQSDLVNRVTPGGLLDFDMHENSFFFDEPNNVIYISLLACSRILKISYPDGKVLETYGDSFGPGAHSIKNVLFYGQHACRLSEAGYLYLFNNNTRTDSSYMPEIAIMREPVSDTDSLRKIWAYNCNMDYFTENRHELLPFRSGGNVVELPDSAMFVCMPGPYSKIFIVGHSKELLWCAIPEKKVAGGKWRVMPQYRASMICSRKDLERLIWNRKMYINKFIM